ncbi:lipopolysaccharide heptosyltransferase II [candidate division KSB1 bacterium]|nr:lipopolysaccharide heptosyltransferase II [candidate division KSB1 bacterium]
MSAHTASPEKILIIRLSAIGDILLATPLLRALRQKHPQAKLDFVVKTDFADVLRHHPEIDCLYELNPAGGWTELRSLGKRLQHEHYDVVLDIHKNFRSRYLVHAAKPRQVLRHRKHVLRRWLFVKTKINFMREIPPIYQRYLAAAAPLGITATPAPGLERWLELFWSANEEQEAARTLAENNWQPDLPLIGLAPGAGYFTKRWPPEYFGELAAEFMNSGNQVVVLGGPHDFGLAKIVAKRVESARKLSANSGQMRARFIDLTGALSLLASAAVIKRCQLLVANDSGLMHVAEAVGTPLIAIFGSTTRELGFFPQIATSRVVENHDLNCRPCSHLGYRQCPRGHFRCMREVLPAEVLTVANKILGF